MTRLKRVWFLTAVAFVLFGCIFAATASVQAFSETYDPFVSRPMGPFALLSNPATALDVHSFTIKAGLGQGLLGTRTSQYLGYVEPDIGLGAGVIFWHGNNLANGNKHRQIGYTVARPINKNVYYGFTLKHVNEDKIGVWAADLGLMTTDLKPLRGGLVVHNFVGQSTINPTHVTGSLSYALVSDIAMAVSISSPTLADTNQMEMGIAVDMPLPFVAGSTMRLGRITNVVSLDGYWLGSVTADLNSVAFDTTLVVASGNNRRIAVGLAYRF